MIFTDDSIPFAAGKAQMIEEGLEECNSVSVLSKQNIPIPDAGTRTPQAFSTLVTTLGEKYPAAGGRQAGRRRAVQHGCR